jgi:hypothetical protein
MITLNVNSETVSPVVFYGDHTGEESKELGQQIFDIGNLNSEQYDL